MNAPVGMAPPTPARRGRAARAARWRVALVSLLALALLAACSDDDSTPAAEAAESSTTMVPSTTVVRSFDVVGGDLYSPPDPLPGERHGDLVWVEPIEQWWGSPRRAWRILYRSESVRGEPIAVSGYVIAPPADAASADGELPIVSWAHGTVGSADQCAPSRSFGGSQPTEGAAAAVASQLTSLVDAGAVVVASDYEGLGTPGPHPFLVGESAGRGVLDAALAVRQLPDVTVGDQLAVYGLSQGGHAALWAAQLAPTWAPELELVGTVAAAPFSEVDLLLPAAGAISGAEGYLVLGVYGQAAANPDLDPTAVLDQAVVAQASLIEEACLQEVADTFRQLAQDSGRPIASLTALGEPAWAEQLQSIKPGMQRIETPLLIAQGGRDTTIPAVTTDILVTRLCQNGSTVAKVMSEEAGHSEIVVAADAEIRQWLSARLDGEPATSTCPGG